MWMLSYVEFCWAKLKLWDFKFYLNIFQSNRHPWFVNRWIVLKFCLEVPKTILNILTVGISYITSLVWYIIFYRSRKIWAGSARPGEPNLPGRVLQATNTSSNVKESFSSSFSSPKPSPHSPQLHLHHHKSPVTATNRLCLPSDHCIEKNCLIRT